MLRRRASTTSDEGSAALEFIAIGVILLVPLAYLVIVLGIVQENTLGIEAAARHTARAVGQASNADMADGRAEAILTNIADEYGIARDSIAVDLSCVPAQTECPYPGATVIVTVRAAVHLPFVPPIFGLDSLATIPLEASAAQKVSRLWGSE